MTINGSHLGWNFGGSIVRNLTLVNDKTNKEIVKCHVQPHINKKRT